MNSLKMFRDCCGILSIAVLLCSCSSAVFPEIIEDQDTIAQEDEETAFTTKKGGKIELSMPEEGSSLRADDKNAAYEEDEEDREFAHRLFRNTLLNADYYRKLISENTKNWEFNRIALMDLVIMQIALAEMLTFPNIPLSVTLNEYVDVAKVYSTPRSAADVNGLLHAVAKKLATDKLLTKTTH